MYEWLFGEPGYVPPGWDPQRAHSALAEAIAAPDSIVLVADDGDELFGLCTAYLELNSVRFGRRCWVEDLAVAPGRRSHGVGGRLLDAAADWARARRHPHRARHRPGAHRRAALLRAPRARLGRLQLLLEALSPGEH